MIEPTVGRIVWFHPAKDDIRLAEPYETNGRKPMAAQIACVHNIREVNLMVVCPEGYPHPRQYVRLIQNGEALEEGGAYCEWMPYQKKKSEMPSPLQVR